MLTLVFSGVTLCGVFIAFTMENFLFFSINCLIISILLGIGNGAVFKMVPEISKGNTGAVTGIVGAIGGVGGFFPPIVLGLTKDLAGDYVLGFLLLSILSLFCLILNHKGVNKTSIKVRAHKSA
nr:MULTISPECIES: hypothetical protein [unclassified Bacillus (in: firmicutes)]